MKIMGIDPGPTSSAYVIWDGTQIEAHETLENERMLLIAKGAWDVYGCMPIAIEWIEGYGKTVGNETFQTCRWVGRFEQAAGGAQLISRRQIKAHLCDSQQVGDSHIRQALIDRIGQPGTKRKPGPTHGVNGHEWAALAVAVVAWDREQKA